ncbi:MAG: hypothetical protein ACXVUE_08960 [Solirubrobacteraceae bacterium]
MRSSRSSAKSTVGGSPAPAVKNHALLLLQASEELSGIVEPVLTCVFFVKAVAGC